MLKDSIPTDFSGGLSNQMYSLSDLLVMIPTADAEALLRERWAHLRYSPRMIQTALRVGTPECVTLARQALEVCPAEIDVFRLAFSSLWERANGTNPLTVQHLQNLLPYLDRMKVDELLFLAWRSEKANDTDGAIARWLREHIVPRLSPEERGRVRVADDFFLRDLDRQFDEVRFRPFAVYEIREPTSRHDFPRRQLDLLDGWLRAHPTLRGLEIAAAQIVHIGSRADLALLDRYEIDGPPEKTAAVQGDAAFAVRKRSLS
jgi:hypothetical protein